MSYPIPDDPSFILVMVGGVILTGIFSLIVAGVLTLVHFLLTLPMRRAERARLFLDLIGSALQQGRPVEETILSLAQSRDLSMGPRFHLVAARLEENLSLAEAIGKSEGFLPPQVNAMLASGIKIGDLSKVLPACRQLLKDSVSQTRAAISYLVILTFVITPLGAWVTGVMKVFVIPKLLEVSETIGGLIDGVRFAFDHLWTLLALQAAVLVLLWFCAIVYMGGPRVVSWLPFLERIHYWMPWRRKRMQRDFSTMLAILLDSGMPEPEAVALAGDCTANKPFRRRAERALDRLQQGKKLGQAIQVMDDTGEFGWRLSNAFHGHGGFLKALAGWHESLDAKAFQEEQASAHLVTTALVFLSGAFVALIVISVFMFLISLVNDGVLW